MKKILYISQFWITELQGGAELEAHDFCLRLMNQGFEVEVATFSPPSEKQLPYPITYFPQVSDDFDTQFYHSLYKLREFLSVNYDRWDSIILFGNLLYNFSLPEMNSKTKFIARVWDLPHIFNTGWQDWPYSYIKDLYLVGTDYHVDAMNTHNISPKLSLPPANLSISKPIDFDYEEWKNRPYDFGFINPIPHKGISVVSGLISTLPNKSFLIKKGNYQYQHMVDALDKWYSNVTVDCNYYDTMDHFYRQCRYILYPSLQEGFGMVTYEAMSQGCLVFANDHPIIRSATGEGPVYIDAYPQQCNQNYTKYMKTNSTGQYNYDMESAVEEWKDVIEDTINDKNKVLSHIHKGLEAGARLQETTDLAYQKFYDYLSS